MMANEGKLELLRMFLLNSSPALYVRLFLDDITPDEDTVFADFTEPSFAGYAAIPTTSITWPDPAINGDEEGESDGPTITWTKSADALPPQVVHGIWISFQRGGGSPVVFWADRFTDPITITDAGDEVQKKLNWFDQNLVP